LNRKESCVSGCVIVEVVDAGVIDVVLVVDVVDVNAIVVVSLGQRFGEETTLPSTQTYSLSTSGSLMQPPIKRTEIKSRTQPRIVSKY
jgi:hypothetical protein